MFLKLSDAKITASEYILTSPGLKPNKVIDLIYRLVNVSGWIRLAPGHLKTQEMCNEVVQMKPCSLAYVLDHFKTQKMCERTVEDETDSLEFVSNNLKTKRCMKEPLMHPSLSIYVPDRLETQEMCNKPVKKFSFLLEHAPDNLRDVAGV